MSDCVGYRTEISEISSLIERVESVHKRLNETITVMQVTADRVLGPQPDFDSDGCGGNSPASSGLMGAFRGALDIFENDIDRAKELADRLARL